MRRRDNLVNDVKKEVMDQLAAVSSDPKYPRLLSYLIVQVSASFELCFCSCPEKRRQKEDSLATARLTGKQQAKQKQSDSSYPFRFSLLFLLCGRVLLVFKNQKLRFVVELKTEPLCSPSSPAVNSSSVPPCSIRRAARKIVIL